MNTPNSDEFPFYVVEDTSGRIAPEHYCAAHLIGEGEYLAKHGLADSGDIFVNGVDEDDDGPRRCDEPGCRYATGATTEHTIAGDHMNTPTTPAPTPNVHALDVALARQLPPAPEPEAPAPPAGPLAPDLLVNVARVLDRLAVVLAGVSAYLPPATLTPSAPAAPAAAAPRATYAALRAQMEALDDPAVPDGAQLRARREALNLSQAVLAARSTVSRGVIAEIETGTRRTRKARLAMDAALRSIEQRRGIARPLPAR